MKKVLIVDPSKPFAQFAQCVLSRLGYDVIHLVSVKEALEKIVSLLPGLIISEAIMEDMNGIDLCNKIREKNYAIDFPVVIVSVDGTMETKQIAQKAGCIDYLTKPVTAKEIHELMERHLSFKYKRNNIRTRMTLKAIVNDGRNKTEMLATSISEGGMHLCTEQPFEVGSKLDIDLLLPSLRPRISLKGEVIYRTKGSCQKTSVGLGVKFVAMDHVTVTFMRHYMESYLSDFLPESP